MRVSKYVMTVLLGAALSGTAIAQTQSGAPADRALAQNISKALVKAGIDPRITSVQVIVAADHTVYLKGLISDPNMIQRAVSTAQQTAPGYRVVNNIQSSFFGDATHLNGGITK
jgi:osmotically-inducible protein OsmY